MNHKAERQQASRELRKGNRYERQRKERNLGPNIRVYESLGSGKGYIQVRLRDGKRVSTTPV
jgi:spore maturation protein CgeB